MKKLVALFLSLLMFVSVVAVSLHTVDRAVAANPGPAPTTVVIPGNPDGLNSIPPREATEGRK